MRRFTSCAVFLLGLPALHAQNDRPSYAHDARGQRKELWSAKTDIVAHANPITYMGKDGKQYIAIAPGPTFLTYRLP